MVQAETQIRVRYAETDRMGYVYYGNYATYFEVGRVDLLRKLGFTYKGLEDSGVMLPVLELKTKFIRPALYDDLLTVKTEVRTLPNTRIQFHYEVYSEAGTLLNVGETTLVFVDMARNKPCQIPDTLKEAFEKWFK